MSKLNLALRALAAHSNHDFGEYELPQNSVQYAATPEDLYEYTASKGGISDAHGEPDNLESPDLPQPNAQRCTFGFLRLLASRLGAEDDPLTKNQENYGTGGSFSGADTVELFDPATSSSYARECNSVETAEALTDDPEPATGFNMWGQEGMLTKAYSMELAKALQDGDFDPAGRQTGDRLITDDPKTNGYLNIHMAKKKTKKKSKKHKKSPAELALIEEMEIDSSKV